MTNLSTRRVAADSTPTAPPAGVGRRIRWLGPIGIVVAIALSVAEWLVVRGPDNDGTVLQALLALTMTVPVVLARRWPVPAAGTVAVAALVNGLLFPDLVRCAGAFPAVLYIAFAVGAWSRAGRRGWAWPAAGLALSLAAVVAQYLWDPALQAGGAGFLAFGPGLAVLCWAGGLGWSFLAPRIARSRAT